MSHTHNNPKIEAFKTALEAKGIKVAIYNANEEYMQSDFGWSLGKGVWHWFKFDNDYISFNHTYSQNNGKTKKGIWHSIVVRDRLSAITSIPFHS